ncbi:hypothetical protein ETB97_012217, partial [Aspergillus alliaceus]
SAIWDNGPVLVSCKPIRFAISMEKVGRNHQPLPYATRLPIVKGVISINGKYEYRNVQKLSTSGDFVDWGMVRDLVRFFARKSVKQLLPPATMQLDSYRCLPESRD